MSAAGQFSCRLIDRPAAEQLLAGLLAAGYEQRCSYALAAASAVSSRCEFVVIERSGNPVGFAAVRIRTLPVVGLGLAYVARAPVLTGEAGDIETWSGAVDALVAEYVGKRGLVLRIAPPLGTIPGPVLADSLARRGFQPRARTPYATFVLDLDRPLADIRRGLNGKWRNDLSRSEREPIEIIRPISGDGFRDFSPLFDAIATTKGFATAQGPDFFAAVAADAAADERIEVHLALQNGVAVAGHVGSFSGDTAVYLLGASGPAGRDTRAAYLLQWAAIARAQSLGQRHYDLGGVDEAANPDVFRFKERMGGNLAGACADHDLAPSAVAGTALALFERTAHNIGRWRNRKG